MLMRVEQLKREVPLEMRMSLLRQHGSFPQAYSATCQADLSHFGDHRGFIAYKLVGRTAMVLADPIAPPDYRDDLVSAFVSEFKDVVFCQTSRWLAELLASWNFKINEFGLERRIDLATFTVTGKANTEWRNATNRMAAQGVVIRECPFGSIEPGAIDDLSARWRKSRTFKNRELGFIARPLVTSYEPDVRRFFAFDSTGTLVAIALYDPVYENGRVVAYVAQTKRYLPDFDPRINLAILRRAMETFRSEGATGLYLGLAPFAEMQDRDFNRDWLAKRAFTYVYRNKLFNRYVFAVQNHAYHKRKFGGVAEQTYFALNTAPSLPRIIKLMRVCRMLPF
jgi:lysylphosphatidylglycerol synthetase-like protein (DUF2156 family)